MQGRRIVVNQYAATPQQAAEAFALEPMERPDTLGPHEVLVRVTSAAVGWVDLLMASGQYQHLAPPPYTPGLEGAGEIEALGPDVQGSVVGQRLAVGQAVLLDGLRMGPRSSGPYQRWGTFATWVVAPARAVIPLPDTLTPDQGAGLLSSYETAYHCLVTRGRLQAGETVLIHGASGATGLAAVQVAKVLGATVIATGRSAERLAIVREQGADHVVQGPFREAVKQLTQGQGVDVVYDGVGGDVTVESLRCVAFGARLLIVGWAGTPDAGRGAQANVVPTNLVMMKGVDVLGCPMAIATARDPTLRGPRLAQVLQWAREGKIRPHVSHAFAMEDFREALAVKWRGEVVGGAVLRV